MLDNILGHIRPLIPKPVFNFFQPFYHWSLAFLAAIVYRFPSKNLTVIAVTGTKGKSSTTEILNAILEQAGNKTAVSNTIRFKIGEDSVPNMHKMSMPGRFSMQNFLRKAVNAGCKYAVIEMTSQGASLYRHLFIDLDMLIFTNLSPEHIEAHGSYENYVNSKLAIGKSLERSAKKNKVIVANGDDKESARFLNLNVPNKIVYGIKNAEPFSILEQGLEFTLDGKKIRSPLSGKFNLYNILGAVFAAKKLNISTAVIAVSLQKFGHIPGRLQKIEMKNFGSFAVVDYAHTPDSLEKFYQVFQSTKNICVLGGTGGGRDTWKREQMGKIADQYCEEIILTNEDPYDEDPRRIIDDVAKGITVHQPSIILDRREAIREALKKAGPGKAVLITGKGTDPYIMGSNGSKIPWSDAEVVLEEIQNTSSTSQN